MIYPDDIFTALDNNSDRALASYVGEFWDIDANIPAASDPAQVAEEYIADLPDWFSAEIAEHGKDAVQAAIETTITAYLDERARDLEAHGGAAD